MNEKRFLSLIHIGINSKWTKDINMRPKPPDAIRGKSERNLRTKKQKAKHSVINIFQWK